MRVRRLGLLLFGACTFTPPAGVPDALDAPPDVAPDVLPSRVRDGLIALWTFDAGAELADTAGVDPAIPLVVPANVASPVFADGTATAAEMSALSSGANTRIPAACEAANAVTLEVWATPSAVPQGKDAEGAYVVGISADIAERNVALMQGGDHWKAAIRTGANYDGKPELKSAAVVETRMTHVAVVLSGNERTIYVDGTASGMASGTYSLARWDATYPVHMFRDPRPARAWLGTLGLVAIYARALAPEEIAQNFAAGPAAP